MSEIIENKEPLQPNEQGQSLLQMEQPVEQRKGFHPFYLFPLLYVLSVYCDPIILGLSEDYPICGYLVFLPVVLGVCNIIVSIVFCKPQNRIMMLNAAVMIKYCLIPFFLVGGILEFFTFFIPVPIPLLGPMIAAALGVMGWVILVLSAPYTISYLRLSRKAEIRPRIMAILHGFLQFFFTVDVIDVMVLTFRERKWRKLTIAVLVLMLLAILALILLLLLYFLPAFL